MLHKVTITQPYGKLSVKQKDVQHMKNMHVVLSIVTKDDVQRLPKFLNSYQSSCLSAKHFKCSLLILHYSYTVNKITRRISNYVKNVINQHVSNYLSLHNDDVNIKVSRIKITHTSISYLWKHLETVRSVFSKDDHLLVMLDTNAVFSVEFLLRCQIHTQLHESVYYPVSITHKNTVSMLSVFSGDLDIILNDIAYYYKIENGPIIIDLLTYQTVYDLFNKSLHVIQLLDPNIYL